MKIAKMMAIICCAAVFATMVSCHHDDDEETLKYMSSGVSFSMPTYELSGATLTLTPSGAKTESGGPVGYYWYTSLDSTKDTTRFESDPADILGTFSFTIPEDYIGTITVTCTAFAADHYSTSNAGSVVAIDKTKSLVISGVEEDEPFITDPRDGREYKYVTLGGRDWFAENLSYNVGRPCLDYEVLRDFFGGMYTWDEAVSACPEGWTLPTAADWQALSDNYGYYSGDLMAVAYFNDNRMWEYYPTVTLTGNSGLRFLPCGYGNVIGENECAYSGFGSYAVFWNADEVDAEKACYNYIYVALPDISTGSGSKSSMAASVRCVRNTL